MRSETGLARLGAVLWILSLQIFIVERVAMRLTRPAQSFTHDYVSNMGIVTCSAAFCSPLHSLFNASFAAQGILFAVGALLLWRVFPQLPESSAALVFLGLSGAGIAIAGLMPGDLHHTRHVVAGTLFFTSGSVAVCLFGMVWLNAASPQRRTGWAFIAVGASMVVTTVMLQWRNVAIDNPLMRNIGMVERVPAYGIPLSVATMGALLLARRPMDHEGKLRMKLMKRFHVAR